MANTDPKLSTPEQAAVNQVRSTAAQYPNSQPGSQELATQEESAVAGQAQAALTTTEQEEHPSTSLPVIAVRNLTKTYILGRRISVPALQGVSLEVYPGGSSAT